jgi:hypothetical protein
MNPFSGVTGSLMISEVIRNGNPDEHPENDRRSIP